MTDLTELRTSAQRLQQELDTLKQTIAEKERQDADPVPRPTQDNKGFRLPGTGKVATEDNIYFAHDSDGHDNWRPTYQEASNEQALRKLKKRFKDATARLRAQYPGGDQAFFQVDNLGDIVPRLAGHRISRAYWLQFPGNQSYRLKRMFTATEIRSVITDSWTGEDQ